MSKQRAGTCGAPGPYAAHCTERIFHDYSCYDASDDVSFNAAWMRDTDAQHRCDDPTCDAAE